MMATYGIYLGPADTAPDVKDYRQVPNLSAVLSFLISMPNLSPDDAAEIRMFGARLRIASKASTEPLPVGGSDQIRLNSQFVGPDPDNAPGLLRVMRLQ